VAGWDRVRAGISRPVIAAIIVDLLGKPIAEVGTWRPRGPFKRIAGGALAGRIRCHQRLDPSPSCFRQTGPTRWVRPSRSYRSRLDFTIAHGRTLRIVERVEPRPSCGWVTNLSLNPQLVAHAHWRQPIREHPLAGLLRYSRAAQMSIVAGTFGRVSPLCRPVPNSADRDAPRANLIVGDMGFFSLLAPR
jgi:hypothetical protein